MTINVTLREMITDDLPTFYEQQSDATANYMAAFTPTDPADRNAFTTRWLKILRDDNISKKTIIYNGDVAGQVLSFEHFGEPHVSYWIAKEHWGKGVATSALSKFLADSKIRPLYARAVKDNIGSIRVLEKCGFTITGEDKGFSNARGTEVEEFILKLDR
ncbi:acetyltransferase [Cohnella kolymensis]|uniref:Acetyltransferase n=1 Tax=Cohnella kolymensis TaxID=1590652 RepID=A0ABR5A1T3_9BACL|nr:GNAT family N-acetyltransferase [Cohnella kolymensis]KIL35023.1 acetyltransferase [Cohnella kolymensis]